MRFKKLIVPLLFLCFGQKLVHAQLYPVQGNSVLVPPYSVHWADYTTRSTDRVLLNIVLANQTRPELAVRLRLRVEGVNVKIETKSEFIGPQILLQGGIPLRLTGADLAEYFNPNNLNFSGITQREFEKTGTLPQGFYQFCFEVLEYNRGVKVSNTICAPAWLILNDPPIVNIPRNNEKLKITTPQNVILQWTPRHTGSPNSAFMTEYEVTMVEVWPSNRNPNDAILTSPPILEATTKSTSYIYGPAETPLEPGRRYAFRVRAKSIVGVEEYDLFKNNGYSEVYSFVYGDACEVPLKIAAVDVGAGSFRATWDPKFNHNAFKVRIREANNEKAEWYTTNTSINEAVISALKSNTTYEYQVAGSCGAFESPFTQVVTVKTTEPPVAEYACGVPLENFNLDPADLLPTLNVGDVINAGDFDVKVSKTSGSNGVFTGEGVIEVPFFNKAKVKLDFASITVNKEYRLINGYMNVTGAGVDVIPAGVLNAMDQLSEVLDQVDGALDTIEELIPEAFDPHSFVADTVISLPQGINFVYTDPSTGEIIITDNQGTQQRLPPGTSVAVKDDAGKGFLVDKKGNVHQTTAAIAAKAGNREYNLILKFSDDPNAVFGFDEKKVEALASEYEQLKGGYFVSWKALETGKTDPAIASLQNSSIDKSKIKFQMGGVDVSTPPIGSSQTTVVPVPGKGNDTIEDLIAIYTPSENAKEQVLGKVKVASYSMINKEVVIVPVNNAQFPGTINDIKARLDEIYHQAVVNWTVTQATTGVTVTLGAQFDDGESGLLTNYTDDMKKVINAYKNNMVDDKFYLFIVDNPKSGPSALGYMPRSKQAGFIFADSHGNDATKFATTIAHELGHGAFNLAHIFDEYTSVSRGSTDNLMDYPNGSRLYKYQWDKIRHPEIVIGLFEEDEQSESAENNYIVINTERIFLSPVGSPIYLPAGSRIYAIHTDDSHWPDWALYTFEYKAGNAFQKVSIGRTSLENGVFFGYLDFTVSGYPFWLPNQNKSFHSGVNTVTIIKKDPVECKFKLYDIQMTFTPEQLAGFGNGERNTPKISGDYVIGENVEAVDQSNELRIGQCAQLSSIRTRDIFDPNSSASFTLKDYSNGTNNRPFFTEEQKSKTIGLMEELAERINLSVNTYLLNDHHPEYTARKQEYDNDPAKNKILIILKEDRNEFNLEFKLTAPQWLLEIFPNGGSDCTTEYVNGALDSLHNWPFYQMSDVAARIQMEYAVAIYKSAFSSLYCATSEEAVANASATKKFFAGALHELIATVDVADMVQGLFELGRGVITSQVESYISYYNDLEQTFVDFKNNTAISQEDLVSRMMPPPIRAQVDMIKKCVNVGENFVSFYITDCGTLCPYRYGQVTVMVVPLVITAGQWAVVKGTNLLSKFRTFRNLNKTEDVAQVLIEAEKSADEVAEVSNEAGQIIVKTEDEAGNLIENTTIENPTGTVKITKAKDVYAQGYRWALSNGQWTKWTAESRRLLNKKLKELNKILPDEAAHHKIPCEILKENPIAKEAVDQGFDFSGEVSDINGKGLKKVGEHTGGVGNNSKSHATYNRIVNDWITNNRPSFPNKTSREFLESIVIPKINKFIDEARALGMTIDDYAKSKTTL